MVVSFLTHLTLTPHSFPYTLGSPRTSLFLFHGSPQSLEDSSDTLCPQRSFLTQAKYPIFFFNQSSYDMISSEKPSLSGSGLPAFALIAPCISHLKHELQLQFSILFVWSLELSFLFDYKPHEGRDRVCGGSSSWPSVLLWHVVGAHLVWFSGASRRGTRR